MILPIVSYGSPILNKVAKEITSDYSNLNELINNMWETMYSAQGVGLAAPQVGVPIRLFVIDASPFVNEKTMNNQEIETLKKFKKIFINPKIILEEGKMCDFNEGCLSIPEVREDISRKEQITLEYFDEKFNYKNLKLKGLPARVVQHEYDHIEGILFTDHLSPLKKRLIKGKLNSISKGIVSVDYKMRFPKNIKR